MTVAAAGYRAGGARSSIIDELDGLDCCRSAQELHDRLRAHGREVGLASVYRALDTLAGLELVQRVELGDGTARYEAVAPSGEHHHHLVCVECGRVEPFDDDGLEAAITAVSRRASFAVREHEVVLRGRCAACAASRR